MTDDNAPICYGSATYSITGSKHNDGIPNRGLCRAEHLGVDAMTRTDAVLRLDEAIKGIETRVRYAKNDSLDMEWERIAIRMATIVELAGEAAQIARELAAGAVTR